MKIQTEMFHHFVMFKWEEERAESKLMFLKIRFWKSYFSDFSTSFLVTPMKGASTYKK